MHLLNCWRVESTQDSLTIQCDQHPNAVDVTYWSIEQYVSWCLSLLRCYLLLVSYFSISLQIDENLDISWRDFIFIIYIIYISSVRHFVIDVQGTRLLWAKPLLCRLVFTIYERMRQVQERFAARDWREEIRGKVM